MVFPVVGVWTYSYRFGDVIERMFEANYLGPQGQNPHPSKTEECGTRKLFTRRD
jgi:hypothetical protein